MRSLQFRWHHMYHGQQWSVLRLYTLPVFYLSWRRLLLRPAQQHCVPLVQVQWASRQDFRHVQIDRRRGVNMTAGVLSVCMSVFAHGVSIMAC